eukprot:403364628
MFFNCNHSGCDKVFNCKKALKEHERTHNEDRPFKCDLCDQTFTQYSSLQKHARVHDKKKPYKCNFDGCDQAFSQVSNLIRHQRIHTGEKPYTCKPCGKQFASGSNLKQHLQIHEQQEERSQYQCVFQSFLLVQTIGFHLKEGDDDIEADEAHFKDFKLKNLPSKEAVEGIFKTKGKCQRRLKKYKLGHREIEHLYQLGKLQESISHEKLKISIPQKRPQQSSNEQNQDLKDLQSPLKRQKIPNESGSLMSNQNSSLLNTANLAQTLQQIKFNQPQSTKIEKDIQQSNKQQTSQIENEVSQQQQQLNNNDQKQNLFVNYNMYFFQNNDSNQKNVNASATAQRPVAHPPQNPFSMMPQTNSHASTMPNLSKVLSQALQSTIQNSIGKQQQNQLTDKDSQLITFKQKQYQINQKQNQQQLSQVNKDSPQQIQNQITQSKSSQLQNLGNLYNLYPRVDQPPQQQTFTGQTQLVQTPYGTFLQARVPKVQQVDQLRMSGPMGLGQNLLNQQQQLINQQQKLLLANLQQPKTLTDIINSQIENQNCQNQSQALQTLRFLHNQQQRQSQPTFQMLQNQLQQQQILLGNQLIKNQQLSQNLGSNNIVQPINLSVENVNILKSLKQKAEQEAKFIPILENAQITPQQFSPLVSQEKEVQKEQVQLQQAKDIITKDTANSCTQKIEREVGGSWQQALFIQTSLHTRDGARKEDPEDFIRDDPKRLIFQVEQKARQKPQQSSLPSTNESNHTSATSAKLSE